MEVTVTPDKGNKDALRLIREFPRLAKRATQPAINRTAQRVRTQVVSAVFARTNVKRSILNSRIRAFSKGKRSRHAKIWVGGSRIALGRLGKVRDTGQGATVGVVGGERAGAKVPLAGRFFNGRGPLPASHRYARLPSSRTASGSARTAGGVTRSRKNYLPIVDVDRDLKYDLLPIAQPVIDRNFERWVQQRFPVELDGAVRAQLKRRGLLA